MSAASSGSALPAPPPPLDRTAYAYARDSAFAQPVIHGARRDVARVFAVDVSADRRLLYIHCIDVEDHADEDDDGREERQMKKNQGSVAVYVLLTMIVLLICCANAANQLLGRASVCLPHGLSIKLDGWPGSDELHDEMLAAGLGYGPAFRGLRAGWRPRGRWWARA